MRKAALTFLEIAILVLWVVPIIALIGISPLFIILEKGTILEQGGAKEKEI